MNDKNSEAFMQEMNTAGVLKDGAADNMCVIKRNIAYLTVQT